MQIKTILATLLVFTTKSTNTLRFGGTSVVFGSSYKQKLTQAYAQNGYSTDVIPNTQQCQPHTLSFINNLLVENSPYDVCHVVNKGLDDIRNLRIIHRNHFLIQADNLVLDNICLKHSDSGFIDEMLDMLCVFNPNIRVFTLIDLESSNSDVLEISRNFHHELFINSHWVTKSNGHDDVSSVLNMITQLNQ